MRDYGSREFICRDSEGKVWVLRDLLGPRLARNHDRWAPPRQPIVLASGEGRSYAMPTMRRRPSRPTARKPPIRYTVSEWWAEAAWQPPPDRTATTPMTRSFTSSPARFTCWSATAGSRPRGRDHSSSFPLARFMISRTGAMPRRVCSMSYVPGASSGRCLQSSNGTRQIPLG